jgi:hypothetical protein
MAKTTGKKVARAAPAAAGGGAEQQSTCFVVTGFGNKTDYSTGRVLNLDKTYEQLIQPACDAVNVNCFRAIDANVTGSIDSIMYRWIYQADMVIADLSTLNANVFYELGVRHAQRPNTTIIIAESVLIQRIPFDLSSFVVHKYEHGGEDISAKEQVRFVAHLSEVLRRIIASEQRRQRNAPHVGRETDSPVYKFLSGMKPPAYEADTFVEPPAYIPPAERRQREVKQGESLASIIDAAEAAKKTKNFAEAARLFDLAIQRQTEGKPDGKPDVYLAQRLALVTYKHGERKDAAGNTDRKVATDALIAAEQILAKYCEPKISNDPETLGLSGAINKRLFELTNDQEYLARAIRFYERGFYVKQDYYNGINVAYMYNQRANLLDDRFEAIVNFGHANMIRRHVVEICDELIEDEAAFANRGDQEWVYMTLAEAYQGLGRSADEERLQAKIASVGSDFGKQSYTEQRMKLQAAMDEFRRRVRPDELSAAPAAAAAPTGPAAEAPVRTPPPRPSGAGSLHPITIDADIAPGRTIKSLEINCKIEYL